MVCHEKEKCTICPKKEKSEGGGVLRNMALRDRRVGFSVTNTSFILDGSQISLHISGA